MSERRIKPGVTISKEVWEKFKEAYPENTSRKLEKLMESSLNAKDLQYFKDQYNSEFVFEDAKKWNISWENSSMVVSSMNINYSVNSYTTTSGDIGEHQSQIIIKGGGYKDES